MQTCSKMLVYESLINILLHAYLESKPETKFAMVTAYMRKLHFSHVPAKFLHQAIVMIKVFIKLHLDDIYASSHWKLFIYQTSQIESTQLSL